MVIGPYRNYLTKSYIFPTTEIMFETVGILQSAPNRFVKQFIFVKSFVMKF